MSFGGQTALNPATARRRNTATTSSLVRRSSGSRCRQHRHSAPATVVPQRSSGRRPSPSTPVGVLPRHRLQLTTTTRTRSWSRCLAAMSGGRRSRRGDGSAAARRPTSPARTTRWHDAPAGSRRRRNPGQPPTSYQLQTYSYTATIRYDAVLTCAQKPTLSYSETTVYSGIHERSEFIPL